MRLSLLQPLLGSLSLVSVLPIQHADGQCRVNEGAKLTATDTAEGDQFGFSVSLHGDVAVVGSPSDDDGKIDSGSAFVYRFNGSTWVEEQKLTASDAAASDGFGSSVSISGNLAMIVSPSAYLFGINPVPTDPPCGAIDARQPSAPDGSDPAGWDSIAMTFDEPPGEMNAEDFAVVISPPGDAPTVTNVTVDGNTATVHFDGFIPTQAWTTITHWPTGAVTRIGYLPADVNNDKYSGTNDVLFLVDALNGVIDPMPPSYQTDTDRSGITNLNDVLRVINLLNKSPYGGETWLGATLP
ncbi:MAG: FG-GAP repeat protein [Planctomycetes bacterium]|nr:FG-GAP repeat protein [Planctomycetota bacterium]